MDHCDVAKSPVNYLADDEWFDTGRIGSLDVGHYRLCELKPSINHLSLMVYGAYQVVIETPTILRVLGPNVVVSEIWEAVTVVLRKLCNLILNEKDYNSFCLRKSIAVKPDFAYSLEPVRKPRHY